MVPGTFSSMAAANPASISATATAAGVSARNCGVPPSPLTGLRLAWIKARSYGVVVTAVSPSTRASRFAIRSPAAS